MTRIDRISPLRQPIRPIRPVEPGEATERSGPDPDSPANTDKRAGSGRRKTDDRRQGRMS